MSPLQLRGSLSLGGASTQAPQGKADSPPHATILRTTHTNPQLLPSCCQPSWTHAEAAGTLPSCNHIHKSHDSDIQRVGSLPGTPASADLRHLLSPFSSCIPHASACTIASGTATIFSNIYSACQPLARMLGQQTASILLSACT